MFNLGDTQVVGNQIGYPTENEHDVKTNMNLYIEV